MYQGMLASLQAAEGKAVPKVQALIRSSDVSSIPLLLLEYMGTSDSQTTLPLRVSTYARRR
jgi:hypothetical protein